MTRVPMTTASRRGVSRLAADSEKNRVALTSHGRVVAVVDSAERLDADARLIRESAAAVLDAASDLVSGRGQTLTLTETCQKLGIDPERVRARVDELRNV